MATRMQQRRGTAQQWTDADPRLESGEIGFETDTNQFKIGDGVNVWSDLSYFKNLEDLGGSLDDYVLANLIGAANGIASLDATGNVPLAQLANLIDGAPELLNTINELAAAIDDNATFANTVLTSVDAAQQAAEGYAEAYTSNAIASEVSNRDNAISTHNADTSNVHGIGNTLALVVDTQLAQELGDLTDTISMAYALADATHANATANVHGIADTSALATKTYADSSSSNAQAAAEATAASALSSHASDTTDIHGIADTSVLATATTVATAKQEAIDAAAAASENYADGLAANYEPVNAVSTHNSATTSVHGIADTADLLLKSGGTMTGALTLSGAPSSSLHAATKQYVDNTASGIVAKPQVLAATSTNLDVTYSNGTLGVGATLTATSNGAWPTTVAGATGWVIGKGLLVKNQTNKAHNGRYYLSDLGSASTPWVLTRCGYCDEANEIPGAYIFVQEGTLEGTGWIQTVADASTFVVGTDEINVVQFSGSGTITAGTNISVSGNEVSVVATPSLSGVTFSDGTQTKEGVVSRTPIIQKTASYTLSALTERDSMIEVASSSATTLTIPTNATVAYPVGTSIDVLQTSTGQVTIAGAGGVTVNATPGLKLRTQWSGVTLFKRATDTWVVYGDLMA